MREKATRDELRDVFLEKVNVVAGKSTEDVGLLFQFYVTVMIAHKILQDVHPGCACQCVEVDDGLCNEGIIQKTQDNI